MLKCGGRYVGTYVYNEWVMNTLNILKSANRIWCVLSRYIHKIRTKKIQKTNWDAGESIQVQNGSNDDPR